MPQRGKLADLDAAAFGSSTAASFPSAGLTPRTGRRDDDDHTEDDQQREPLLPSDPSSRIPEERFKEDYVSSPSDIILHRLRQVPLALGLLVVMILVFLAVLSYKQPELLLNVVTDGEDIEYGSMEYENVVEPSSAPPPSLEDPTPPDPSSMAPQYIDYSNYSSFPLEPLEYAAECWKAYKDNGPQEGYWKPPVTGALDVNHLTSESSEYCSSTITYQLDEYVGLMAHLSILSQVAALADERNRTLLIDDRFWNRGSWTDHFQDIRKTQPDPELGCQPPPPEELVACPRTARHWIVNSRTAKHHFGSQFEDHYHDAYAMDLERLHPIYDRAAFALSAIIIPNSVNQRLIQTARRELGIGPYLGIHVRRGDRKAKSRQFRGNYLPLSKFADASMSTWNRLPAIAAGKVDASPLVWVASDSSSASDQLAGILNGNARVLSLQRSQDSQLRLLQPSLEYNQSTWNALTLDQRRQETRGMIVDFAMLSGAWASNERDPWPEAVVCTFTSNVCTLSAVILTWVTAFIDTMWVEIDNAGAVEPIWRAYELF